MSIIRGPRPDSKFYTVDKAISEDIRLSWAARGLLIFLLGKPDHWRVNTKHLVAQTETAIGRSSGREGVLNLLQELKAAGYVRTRQVRKQGRFVGLDYLVSEQPDLANDWEDGESPAEDDAPAGEEGNGSDSTGVGKADAGSAGYGEGDSLVKKESLAKKEKSNKPTKAKPAGAKNGESDALPDGHTYLPPDFKPSEKHAALAQRLGLDLELEWLKFEQKCIDEKWHSGAWANKFNTWLANAKAFAQERGQRRMDGPRPARGARNTGLHGNQPARPRDYNQGVNDDGSF